MCYLIIKCDLSYLASKSLKNNRYQTPCLRLTNQVFHMVSCPASWLLLASFNPVLKTNHTWLATRSITFQLRDAVKVRAFRDRLHSQTCALSLSSSYLFRFFLPSLTAPLSSLCPWDVYCSMMWNRKIHKQFKPINKRISKQNFNLYCNW